MAKKTKTTANSATVQSSRRRKKQLPEKKAANLTPYIFIVLVVALIVWVIAYFFFQRSGVISGQVLDSSTARILQNVTIQLDKDTQRVNDEATGTFTFQGISPGEHLISFSRPGYEKREEKILLKPGAQLNLTVNLTQIAEALADIPTHLAVVSNAGNSQLTLIDWSKHEVYGSIDMKGSPHDALPIRDGLKVYTANLNNDTVSIIDLQKNKQIDSIKLPKGSGPKKVYLSLDKKNLFVLNTGSKNVSYVNLATREIDMERGYGRPVWDMAQDPQSGKMYILLGGGLSIFNADGSFDQQLEIPESRGSQMVFSPRNQNFIIGNVSEILKYDSFGQDRKQYPTQMIKAMAWGDLQQVLYLGFKNSLSIFNPNTEEFVLEDLKIEGNISSMALSPDENWLYITLDRSNEVAVFDVANQTLLEKRIPVGEKPQGIRFMAPDS